MSQLHFVCVLIRVCTTSSSNNLCSLSLFLFLSPRPVISFACVHACISQEYKKREKEEFNSNVSNAKAWAKESKADPKATKQILKEAQTTDGAKAKVQKRREDKQEAQVRRGVFLRWILFLKERAVGRKASIAGRRQTKKNILWLGRRGGVTTPNFLFLWRWALPLEFSLPRRIFSASLLCRAFLLVAHASLLCSSLVQVLIDAAAKAKLEAVQAEQKILLDAAHEKVDYRGEELEKETEREGEAGYRSSETVLSIGVVCC